MQIIKFFSISFFFVSPQESVEVEGASGVVQGMPAVPPVVEEE